MKWAFAREVADRVIFMADGVVVDDGTPEEISIKQKNNGPRNFLSKVL